MGGRFRQVPLYYMMKRNQSDTWTHIHVLKGINPVMLDIPFPIVLGYYKSLSAANILKLIA